MIERFEHFSYAVFEISKLWYKLAGVEMEKHGLKGSHSIYLLALAKSGNEGLTATQLCEICYRDKADVSRMMSIMEDKGLVIKEGNNQNVYRGVFKLTEKGLHSAEYVKSRAARAVELAGGDLDENQRNIFYSSLDSILENLRDLCKNGIPE